MVKNPFKDSTVTFVFWALLLTALIPWFYIRLQQSTHSDILWLCEALQRILAGGKMSEVAYEVNPPLSMLAYILPVLAKNILHVPLHYAVFFQTLTLTILSTLAVYKIISAWKIFQAETVNILTFGYLLCITLLSLISFGERDHLLTLGLVPFVLLQASLNFKLPRPGGWSIPVFALGAVLILLKPHHGLIPTLLLAHRALSQRRLSVIFDPDFLSLAVAVLFYLGIVFFVFPDYVSTIFPNVVHFYLPLGQMDYLVNKLSIVILLSVGLFLLAAYKAMPAPESRMILGLTLCALISLIPYVVQKIGLYYHILPSLAFLSMGLALAFFSLVRRSRYITLTALIGAAYFYPTFFAIYPTHTHFANTPLAKIVSTCPAREHCAFFAFNREMAIMHETAYYTGTIYASRFPSLWFLPVLLKTQKNMDQGEAGPLTPEQFQSSFKYYAGLLADDLEHYKPDHLIIWDWHWNGFGPEQDFMEYFAQDNAFAAAIRPYKKTGTLQIDYIDHYKRPGVEHDILDYTIYERR